MLRVSDPVMRRAAPALERAALAFAGPSSAAMERCYDKYAASRTAARKGIDCPATALATDAESMPFPLVLKPRHGSDSLGIHVLRRGPIPLHARNERHIVQQQVRGVELTTGVIAGQSGMPLRIFLPEGTPYSFVRKYLLRPRSAPLPVSSLAERVRSVALEVARILEVDWAARVDFMLDAATDRLCFLECDVAPLIGPRSAFAASLTAAGMSRTEQLQLLLQKCAQ